MSRLSVCMINAQYRLGGAETVMHQIAHGLTAAGHRHRFVLPSLGKLWPRPPRVRLLYPRLCDRLRYTRWSPLIERLHPARPAQERAFRRLASEEGALFHVHSFTGYVSLGELARLAAQRPVLWSLHCYWGDSRLFEGRDTPYPAAWGLAPQLLRRPRSLTELEALHQEFRPLYETPLWVALPSRAAVEAARQCPELSRWHIHHVPNGVDPALFTPAKKGDPALRARWGLHPTKPVILIVNRDFKIPDKGFPMACEALQCIANLDEWQVMLVGLNAPWAAQNLPARLHVCSHEFVPDRGALAELYSLAEIFLFASQRENFPCATLEAMAAACCVVATPTDGVVEQIADGCHGLLARDISGSSLAAPLQRALADAALRRDLGSNARHRVEADFSETAMVKQYFHLYLEMQAASHRS